MTLFLRPSGSVAVLILAALVAATVSASTINAGSIHPTDKTYFPAASSVVAIDTGKIDRTAGTYSYTIKHGEQVGILGDPAVTASPSIAASANPANPSAFIAIDGRGNTGTASIVFKFDFSKADYAATRLRISSELGNWWTKDYPKSASVTQSVSLDGVVYTNIPGVHRSFSGWVSSVSVTGAMDLTTLPGSSSAGAPIVYYKVSLFHAAPGDGIWNSVQWARTLAAAPNQPGFSVTFDVIKK